MNRKSTFRYSLLLAGSLLATTPGFAAESVESRITRLEEELAALKAQINNKPSVVIPPAVAVEPAKKAEPPASVSTGSGVKVQFYGFARMDASFDTGKINTGNIALWVRPETLNNNDGEWNLTAGATRLGLNLSGPDTEAIKLTGNIELDFLGGGTENNLNPRLRHGYLKAFWPASDFSIIAGQTWDVHSALIPFVDDPGLMWAAGNIGTRHPQLRLTKGFASGEKSRIEVAVAAARTIGEANTWAETWNTDPGKDAAMPTIQGRVGLTTPLFVSNQPATIAVSGHYGQEEWDTDKTGTRITLDSWSTNLELTMPLTEAVTLAGEYFTGSNLDDYWGGVAQGVNNTTKAGLKDIRAKGGWTALRYTLSPSTTFSAGAGLDKPDYSDLANDMRSRNQSVFGNVIHKVTPNFIVGFQVADWRTDYKNAASSAALRAQSSFTYKF